MEKKYSKRIEKLEYSIEDTLESIKVKAIYRDENTNQQKRWAIEVRKENLHQKIETLKNSTQWIQFKQILLGLFNDEFNASFSSDHKQEILIVESQDDQLEKFFGKIFLQLKIVNSQNFSQIIDNLSFEIGNQEDGDEKEEFNSEKKISKLENFCSELLTSLKSLSKEKSESERTLLQFVSLLQKENNVLLEKVQQQDKNISFLTEQFLLLKNHLSLPKKESKIEVNIIFIIYFILLL